MRIHYQNTVDDFRALYYAFPLVKRLEWTYLLPLWLLVVAIPGTLLLVILGDWWALAVGWLLVAAFLTWIFLNLRRSWRSPDPKSLAAATVWFDESSVGSEGPYGWSRCDWSQIREVRETAGHLLLFTAQAEAFAIPRRAFGSPAEADAFGSAARRGFAHSREPGYVPFSPPLPAEMSAAASGEIPTVLLVGYQNTAEELATMQVRGLTPPVSWRKRLANWFWLAVLGVLVVWVMTMRGPVALMAQVGSFLAFVALFFVGVQLWQRVLFWRARRRPDPRQLAPQVLTITPAGLSNRTAFEEHANQWTAIDEIAENDRVIALYITKPRLYAVVPKSAFASPLEAEQFVHLARQWKKLASEGASSGNAPPRLDSGNPYESPAEG